MDKHHIIIVGVLVVILILCIVLVSMKKSENFDYGYPYTYPSGFYPPPDGTVLSRMSQSKYSATLQDQKCKSAAESYCRASSVPGSQKYLGNNAALESTLLGVVESCGNQFPVQQYCSELNPSYKMPDLIRGGLQHTPA